MFGNLLYLRNAFSPGRVRRPDALTLPFYEGHLSNSVCFLSFS